ncbi:MAG: acetate kinase [Chromatiales bacterium]|nr:acetate kinase [Chromatiales bacterium]
MNVLVLNCGSSSLKFLLVDAATESRLARGLVERIGGQALCTYEPRQGDVRKFAEPVRDHRAAVERVMRWLVRTGGDAGVIDSPGEIHAVGHRVVHGGESFRTHARIDAGVIRRIEDCIDLAPLHNPANLSGIRAARALLGDGTPMVAVFDTAFHSTMPEASYLYAIPYQLYRRHRIRRYGFHGTSHAYLARRYAALAGKPSGAADLITLHLGNGCSACAIRQGRSFATSMGFTPLEGLVMGTRCGDVDPSLIEHIALKEGMSLRETNSLLNKQSGLFGVSGLTNDMRELLDEEREHGDRRAALAIDLFVRRVKHYIGAYLAELGGAEAIVFSGGIGENSPGIRRRICHGLDWLGIDLDPARNDALPGGDEGEVGAEGSRVRLFVIPTNEELMIARETAAVLAGRPRQD